MNKMIMVDQKLCTGCRQCELVCSVQHTGTANPSRSRIHIIKWESDGFYLPWFCLQCLEPLCQMACPKGAIALDSQTGCVCINYDRCIGCKMCMMACPFGAISIDRVQGRVIKCNLCQGDPVCVDFCEAGALKFVDEDTASLGPMREHAARFLASLGKDSEDL